jgi:hypothetical protein
MFYLYINKYIAKNSHLLKKKFFFALQTANVAYLKKNQIIRTFCITGWLAVSINPDQWSSTVF